VDLVLTTGGLGPTDADITRQVLSKFTGVELQPHPDVVQAMKARFNNNVLRENLLRQTLTPVKGSYLPNRTGSAVGLVFDDGKKVIIAMPGPPRELQPMVDEQLVPYLSERFGTHVVGASLTIRFVGIGESQIDHTMHQQMDLPEELIIAFKFDQNRVDLTFSMPGNSEEDMVQLRALERELLHHIGEYAYTDEELSLEDVVLKKLDEKKLHLTTAEVGSGGAIASSLNSAGYSTSYFEGGYIAPSNHALADILEIPDEQRRKDPKEFAIQIAQMICKKDDTELCLLISEPFVEGDATVAWMVLASSTDLPKTFQVSLRGSGKSMRERIVTDVLNLLRKEMKIGVQVTE